MNLFVPHPVGLKVVHTMRRTILLLSIVCSATLTLIAAPAAAQSLLDKNLSIDISGKDLKAAIDQIAAAAKIKIFYSGNLTQADHKISIHEKNGTLKLVLDKVLAGLPYSYQEMDNSILIRYDRQKLNKEKDQVKRQNAPPVTGKVTDRSGQPLSGATVKVKGQNPITHTDASGVFSLSGIDSDDVLMISFVGFKTKEITVAALIQDGIVLLDDDPSFLKEVVVSTGYQEVPLERATGSFSKVDNSLYNRQVSTDVVSRLKAITPSLLFDERKGTLKLSIRGRSTIFANDQPLIVIDNFPYDGDINNINPNDVESVTVLKDAAAASIWGVRAGNGVIVITTKRGVNKAPLKIDFNANVTVAEKPDLFYSKQMHPGDFIDVERYLFNNGYYDSKFTTNTDQSAVSPVVDLLQQARTGSISQAQADAAINALRSNDIRTDITRYLLQRAVKQQYEINFKGGTEKVAYYYSAGYDNNTSATVGNGYNRLNLNTQQIFHPIKSLELTAGLNYTQSVSIDDNSTLLTFLTTPGNMIAPYSQLADPGGPPLSLVRNYRSSFVNQATSKGLLNWDYTPLNEIGKTQVSTRLMDLRFNSAIKYKLWNGLSAEIRYQLERQSSLSRSINGEQSYYVRNLVNQFSAISGSTLTRRVPAGAIFDNSNGLLVSNNGRAQLNYVHDWTLSNLSLLAGYEVREINNNGNSSRLYGYNPNTGTSVPVDNSNYYQQYPTGSYSLIPYNNNMVGTDDRFRSYFANGAYTLNNKYTLSASGRIDQSNLFGVATNQKSVPLWSTGLKWDISKEAFYKSEWLPLLSIRGTYGYSGNLDNTVTAFTTAFTSNAIYTGQPQATISNPPNPELRFEKDRIINLGIDFQSQNRRISGSIEYYTKSGKDLIGDGPLDPTTGTVKFRGNVANMTGNGFDIELNSINLTGQVKWNTTLLLSKVTDKVTRYNFVPNYNNYFFDGSFTGSTFDYAPTVSKPLFSIYSYRWAGLDPATGDPLGYLNGKPSKDYANLTSSTAQPLDSLVYNGRATPSVYGSLRNTVAFKNWTLSINLSYKFGYYFRRPSTNYTDLFVSNITNSDYANRWQQPGDEKHTSVPSLIYPDNTNRDLFYARSSVLVEKGDNIRLQDINLSYNLVLRRKQPGGIHTVQVFGYVNNVGLLWTANKKGIDPDFPVLPLSKTWAAGIKTSF